MIIIMDMYDFVIGRINVELWHCNGMRQSKPKRNAQRFLSLARPTISPALLQPCVCPSIPPWQYHWVLFLDHTSEFPWATWLGCLRAILCMRSPWGVLASWIICSLLHGHQCLPAAMWLHFDMDASMEWAGTSFQSRKAGIGRSPYLTSFFSLWWQLL